MFLCVFLPPVFYILTIQGLEKYFQKTEQAKVSSIIIQNIDALYQGQYSVKEEINRNINEYLKDKFLTKIGLVIHLLVKTKDDQILYPSSGEDVLNPVKQDKSLNYVDLAAENYRILNNGIIISLQAEIKQNSWLSNSILTIYILISLFFLQNRIRKWVAVSRERETRHRKVIRKLSDKLKSTESRLEKVESKEYEYADKIGELNREKMELSRDIDELLEEMEKLEAEASQKEQLEEELNKLREELEKVRFKGGRSKKKKAENLKKRFKVLYKNLSFTDRAVEGFLDLSEEFQLKAEEIIHILNEDESKIPVKRKVFGKGGKMNVLETDFSYSGRLYFQKNPHSGIKIVAIGTKNTQDKDLAYLEARRGKS